MIDSTTLGSEETSREGFGSVAVGVVMTVVLWVFVPFAFPIAVAFSPPFLIAIIVALVGRRMNWGVRTARASTAAVVCVSVLQVVWYLRDSGHDWAVGFIVFVELLGVLATWLAWKGGLLLARRSSAAESGDGTGRRVNRSWLAIGAGALVLAGIGVLWTSGSSSSVSCSFTAPQIEPIIGSPARPKNWESMTPAALRAAGWRITPATSVCQTSP